MRRLPLVVLLALLPAAAGAQTAADDRWSAWLGCWDLVLESARDSADQPARSTPLPAQTRPQVCVQPAERGATFTTKVGEQVTIEQTVIADGSSQPIVERDCRGAQSAEWSQSARRLFSRAELTCTNEAGTRRVSGLSILGANGTWTDIQTVTVGSRETVRLRRYRRAGAAAPVAATFTTSLSLDDVKEASAKVSARTLEAALVETRSTFRLTGSELIALQAAGVPGSVTDLMVALSYPDRFVVERDPRGADFAPPLLMDDPYLAGWAFGYPMWSDAFGFFSPLYGPYSPYFYSPFAYSYLGGYWPWFAGGGTGIIIGDGGGGAPRPGGSGRVVNGLGYTRVRPRDAGDSSPGRGSTNPGSSGRSSSSGSGSASSGGGAVTSQGFSSGGSGGSTGRTAQPR